MHLSKKNELLTLEDFLNMNNLSKEVRDLHIYPMISSIWSANSNDVKKFPLVAFLQFFNNHGLFDLGNRPDWRYVKDGSYSYIEKIIKKKLFKYYTNYKIKKIARQNQQIQIIGNNEVKLFDKIVFATHADQVLELLDRPSDNELAILSNFKYTKNVAYLHSDHRLMPKRKLVWSSWNFLQSFENNNNFSMTYWMNKLQNINSNINYFVSINPNFIPKNIVDTTTFYHPIFNINTLTAQKSLGSIQGNQNTYFCGSYCGYGFHEDGIQSAAYIAKMLNIKLPWNRNDEFQTRLNY